MKGKERKRSITVRLPITIDKLVGIEAAQRRIGRSALVELALRRLLKIPKAAA